MTSSEHRRGIAGTWLKATLLAGLCLNLVPAPAQAMLGEDYNLMRNYFNGPKGIPTRHPEKRALMENFAKVRRETRPQSLFFYPDAAGRVQREYWLAPPYSTWTMADADKIRNAVMVGRSPTGTIALGINGLMIRYSDGSLVYYRTMRGQVYSILAVDKSYDPGDLGIMPDTLILKRRRLKNK